LLLLIAPLFAQTTRTITLQVSETAGIRRTEYPVSTRVELPRAALRDTEHVRLRSGDSDNAGQYSTESKWDDGSIRALGIDFNISIGPGEGRTLQIEYGADVSRPPATARGLTVVEDADGVQVGNVKFGRAGAPLILSANYRGDLIGKGGNGLRIVDASGNRRDLGTAQSMSMEILKRGPLLVVVRYTARLPIDGGSVPVTMTCEMPNSKSWIKTTAAVEDPSRRVKSIGFDTPLALGDKPWTWDFGTDSGTYGVIRNPTDAVLLTQTIGPRANDWVVATGSQTELRPYETSAGGRVKIATGWGHILDARSAMAYGIDRFGSEPGVYTIALNGGGQISFDFTPAQPRTAHRFVVYEHFVTTPVAIGAATNPTAMLHPLAVIVK
jgi:hypothetical protein